MSTYAYSSLGPEFEHSAFDDMIGKLEELARFEEVYGSDEELDDEKLTALRSTRNSSDQTPKVVFLL